LASDERILINNRLIEGSILIDEAKNKGNLIWKRNGEELYNIKGLYTYALDKNFNLVRTRAKLFLQEYNGKLLKLTTESGRQVKLTKKHPLLNNSLQWVSSSRLKIGDKIAISNIKIPEKPIKLPNWQDKFKNKWHYLTDRDYKKIKRKTNNFTNFSRCSSKDFNDFRIILNLRYNKIANSIGISYSYITKILRDEKKLTPNIRIKLKDYFKKIDKNKLRINKNEIVVQTEKHPSRVSCRFKDEDICKNIVKWFSILHAEGYSRKKGIVVVQKTYPEILREFIKITKESFGIDYGKIYRDKNNVVRFEIYSTPFIDYLKYKFNLKTGPSRKSTICDWILSLNELYQSIFLRYFFDTESYVNKKGWQISLCQVNKDNLNIISLLLNKFNINNRFNTQIRKDKKNIEYYLTISGKENLNKFIKKIGFSDKKRVIKIKDHLEKLKDKTFPTKFDNTYKNINFDKIKEIEEIKYNGYLIDLVVPKYHNFFAGHGGILCHNTSLLKSLSGRWTDTHSEEIKRGITIRLGYADATFYKCKEHGYTSNVKKCCDKAEPSKRVSFVDAPGHETLMATMLSGAAIMDGALLLVAANEPCPQLQTKEHLTALEIVGIKNIIIVQNKIDLVTKEDALSNYKEIKAFTKGTIAENSPIIPISAIHNININNLIEAIDAIPTPKHDPKKDPIFFIARSFDINKPGSEIKDLVGGVLGGSLKQGILKVKDKIEVKPGRKIEHRGEIKYIPIETEISDIRALNTSIKEAYPGGSVGILTKLDPSLVKADSLAGNIAGLPGKLPNTLSELDVEPHLLEKVVGLKEDVKVEPIKKGEPLMLIVNSTATSGIVTELRKNQFHIKLKRPVCVELNSKSAISRLVGTRWRLIGYGIIKK